LPGYHRPVGRGLPQHAQKAKVYAARHTGVEIFMRYRSSHLLAVLPLQLATTLGDTLSARGVSWVWYAGGWRAAERDALRAPDARQVIDWRHASARCLCALCGPHQIPCGDTRERGNHTPLC
jgi:hypothetical protein